MRREGRITNSQKRALEELWDKFGIDKTVRVESKLIFERSAPLHLEIGFGMGHSLFELATQNRDDDYIGIEVHRPGVGRLLDEIDKSGITNLKIIKEDAIEVLQQQILPQSLDSVMLFFPDPWHKKKHNKRRIVQTTFVETIYEKLKPGGLFHLATDWEEYAHWMMEVMESNSGFKNSAGKGEFTPRPELKVRPNSKFEKRGERLGHGVWDLIFKKDNNG